jgi:hypothetical protein
VCYQELTHDSSSFLSTIFVRVNSVRKLTPTGRGFLTGLMLS